MPIRPSQRAAGATRLALLASALLLPAMSAGAAPAGAPKPLDTPDPAAIARLKADLARFVESGERAGVQWAVSYRGKIISSGARGWRDVAAKSPLTEDTQFRIYSMTRAMTSVLGLRLVEAGKLRMDEPLAKYLPEFRDMQVLVKQADGRFTTVPAQKPIVIRDLFTYTAGFGYAQDYPAELKVTSDDVVGPAISLEQGIRRLAKLPLLNQPGERWHYGWTGDVLGRVIEVVTGKRLDAYFQEAMLGPLGMTHSSFVTTPDRLSRVYGPRQGGTLPDVTDRALQLGSWLKPGKMTSGGGGLLSTARDYLRFCEMLMGYGQRDGVRVLGDAMAREMLSSQLTAQQGPVSWYMPVPFGGSRDPGAWGYGIGLRERGTTDGAVSVAGEAWWGGFAGTGYFVHPEYQIAAVVMTQHLGPGGDAPTHVLRRGVYSALGLYTEKDAKMSRFQGKVAIVTGSSRGIGRAIAETLASQGATVVVNYSKSADAANEVVAGIEARGGRAIAIQADVSRVEDVRRLYTQAQEKLGHVDIVVNNAGILPPNTPVAQETEQTWDTVYGLLKGTYFSMQEAARRLPDGGRIVNVSSSTTRTWSAGSAIYASAKIAVEQMTRSLSRELGPRNITVNAVIPGLTDTEMVSGMSQAVLEGAARNTTLGRLGKPQDIADVVAFVASDEARWITGQNIVANGGLNP